MRTYLTENKVALDKKQIRRLLKTIEKLEENKEFRAGHRIFNLFFSNVPCEENGISISGLKYVHFPYGPVPDNFEILLGKMQADHIAYIKITCDNGYEKHQIIPECDIPLDKFSKEELKVLQRVYDKFAHFGSVAKYSHKEKGYTSTKQGEIIS